MLVLRAHTLVCCIYQWNGFTMYIVSGYNANLHFTMNSQRKLLFWGPQPSVCPPVRNVKSMVPILDGNSEIGAYGQSRLSNLFKAFV